MPEVITADMQKLNEWFQQHIHDYLEITKTEQQDIDRVEIRLLQASLSEVKQPSIDDYLAKMTLTLHGDGHFLIDGNSVPLPQSTFEIPLSGEIQILSLSETDLNVKTDRAQYQFHAT